MNSFGIHDTEKLASLEKMLTGMRLVDLMKRPIRGKFDLNHLKKIHRYLFQNLFTWAGKLRTVDIAKGTLFCHADFIAPQSKKLFAMLHDERCLSGLPREALVERAAFYLGEINAIHPFRDGNGRTQREFMRELMIPLGYHLDYSQVEPRYMLDASIASFHGELQMMIDLIDRCLKPLHQP